MSEATATALKYQTAVYVGGIQFSCVESYESLYERLKAGGFTLGEDKEKDEGTMRWVPPIEVTVLGVDGAPLRAAIQPHAISAICEIPADAQQDVVMPDG